MPMPGGVVQITMTSGPPQLSSLNSTTTGENMQVGLRMSVTYSTHPYFNLHCNYQTEFYPVSSVATL